MTRVLHLVIGPAEHGVVRHATSVAKACGDELLQFENPQRCQLPAGYDVVHVPFTDRLFGSSAEASAAAFSALAEKIRASGARLSTTLHDVPSGESALAERRRCTYRTVASYASGLVVASNAELSHAELLGDRARSRRVIPLPVADALPGHCSPTGSAVAVLGFVYPDRGYEEVIAALAPGMEIVALGRAADGHEDLPDSLCRSARRAGRNWHLTGFLTDEALSHQLRTVAVPVAPNRRTAASASIATWLAHGRRPLVPVSAYARELDRCWPNTLRLYDAGSPGALEAAIRQAHAEPESTLLEPGVKPGVTEAEVAVAYHAHFAACAPPSVVTVAEGRSTVPGNRWDLLAGRSPEPPTVSIVIPYYNAPRQLQLVLAGLRLQRYPSSKIEVIVADDGSAQPPSLDAAGHLTTQVVRQEDQGFRAAAARNLGAAAAGGDVLLFLDGDTVPEPDYVCRMTRMPGLSPDALVVGRRRHADFTGWEPSELSAWLLQEAAPPAELTEPSWLREGYCRSRDLLDVDARSYRYVISAVLGMQRALFDEIGGFCEEFTSYGGEDWELTHRAYCAGALLAHERTAVAWHDGPEWADRDIDVDRQTSKAAETRMLQRLLPDAAERGAGQWLPYPGIVIRLDAAAGPRLIGDAAASAFEAGIDCAIWLTGPDASHVAGQLNDPRIRCAPAPPDALARAVVVGDLRDPADLADLPRLLRMTLDAGETRTPLGRFRTTRAMGRARRHATSFGGDVDLALHVLFGRRDTTTASEPA